MYTKIIVLLISLIMLSMIAVGTMAWFTSGDKTPESIFTAGTVAVEIDLDGEMDFQNINPGDQKDLTLKIKNVGSKGIVFRLKFLPKWLGVDEDELPDGQGILDNIDIGIKNNDGEYEYIRDIGDGEKIDDEWLVDKSEGDELEDVTIYYLSTAPATNDVELGLRVKFDGAKTVNAYQGKQFTMQGLVEAIQFSNDAPNQYWNVDHYSDEVQGDLYVFKNYELDDFILSGDPSGSTSTSGWTKTDYGFEGKYGLLFIENSRDEYVIETKARLQEKVGDGESYGGYGIFFETSLDDEDKEKGVSYILQFDRHFEDIIIRKRVNGDEREHAGGKIKYRYNDHHNALPEKEDDWWLKEYIIEMRVEEIYDEEQKRLTVNLYNSETNEKEIEEFEFTIPKPKNGSNNYTGFRAWHHSVQAEFYEMEIRDID